MVDEVRNVIEKWQSDERLASFDEPRIKPAVIEPILRGLGWDTMDPDEVWPEYRVENNRVDYALLIEKKLKVFVEAKRGGEPLEKHQEQLLDYSFKQGVEIAILSNGSTWWFYLPIRAVNWDQRKVATLEVDRQDSTEIAQKLVDVLGKENVRSGIAIQNAERHQILETLPEVWNQLVNEPDSAIVKLLAEQTHGLCVREPDRNEVGQFLNTHRHQIQITLHPTTPAPVAPPEPDPSSKSKPSGSMKGKKLKSFTFDGNRHEVTTWISMLVRLCELVYSDQKSRFDEVLSLRATPRSKPWFSKNSEDFRESKPIDRTSIVVDSNKSADQIVKIAENLMTHFGYNKGDDWSFDIE